MKMTLRQSTVTVRKGFFIRVVCVVFFCTLIFYAIHLYRKVYSLSSARKTYFIGSSRLGSGAGSGDSFRSDVIMMMEQGFVGPGSSDRGDAAGVGNVPGINNEPQGSPVVNLKHKMVHFDLKGMPPTVEAYKTLFPFLKNIGVTGILMEYEDMFPFHGKLAGIANRAAYNVSDIQTILGLAKSNNLQVIPLIQTFGHLEFVLKLEEFAYLREVAKYPQVICPSNSTSIELVKEMIDQVMSLHPDVEYLHIGSDEVYYLGLCPICNERMTRLKMDRPDLFLHHVTHVATYVKEKHKVQPLMWDDEFRNLDEQVIMRYGVGDLVEIVVWNYHTDVANQLRPNIWQKYSTIFKSVWVGSAFKGANKPNSIAVNETQYLSNHYSWMDVISENQNIINFKGVFLTGWQRYDHFSVLCEIFPVAIPSLVSCMFYLSSTGQQPRMEKIFSIASSYLDCGPDMMFCQFPGSQIYNEVVSLTALQNSMKRIKEQHAFLGWTQNINLQLQFSSPALVEPVLQEIMKLRMELQRLQTNLITALSSMFPQWSVQEWMLTHFHPLASEVTTLEEGLSKLSRKTTFPVRPLPLSLSSSSASDDAARTSEERRLLGNLL